MSDYIHTTQFSHQEIRQEAKSLTDLVRTGRVDESSPDDYPKQLSNFTQDLFKKEKRLDAQRDLEELKQDMHELLPSDFPLYHDMQKHLHVVDLSKIELTVNVMFAAFKNKNGAVTQDLLAQLNEDLYQAQKVHTDRIPKDSSIDEIKRDLAEAFVADFNRRRDQSGSSSLLSFEAFLDGGVAQIKRRKN